MERMHVGPGGGDTITLNETRTFLRENLGEGAVCPCCEQVAKVYRRRVHATLAKALISLYQHGGGREFVHAPSLPGDTHEISQAAWWSLIEEERVIRADGGRAGYWKLTPLGVNYVNGTNWIEEYALVYNGNCFSTEGRHVTIMDAFGTRFSYDELMGR